MARHQSNRSHVRKGDTLYWTVEWCLHQPVSTTCTNNHGTTFSANDAPTIAYSTSTTTALTPETSVVRDVLRTLLSVQQQQDSNTPTISPPVSAEDEAFVVLLKKLPCPAHQPLFIEIATSNTVREALQYATVYEYPTFHIVPHCLLAHFPRMIAPLADDEEVQVVAGEEKNNTDGEDAEMKDETELATAQG